jgi:hypothetical protein
MRAGQTPVQKYWKNLLKMIQVTRSFQFSAAPIPASLVNPDRGSLLPLVVFACFLILLIPWCDRTPSLAPQSGDLDPTFVITHRPPLSQASEAYKMFNNKTDGCVKVVMKTKFANEVPANRGAASAK